MWTDINRQQAKKKEKNISIATEQEIDRVDAISSQPKTLTEKCAKAQLQQEQSKLRTVSWYSSPIKKINSLNNNVNTCVNIDIDNNNSSTNQANSCNYINSVESRQLLINYNKELEPPIDDNHQIQLYHQQIRQHYAQKENLGEAEPANLNFYPIDNKLKQSSERLLSSLLPLSAQSSSTTSAYSSALLLLFFFFF